LLGYHFDMGIADRAIACDGVLGGWDDQYDIRPEGLADCLGRWGAVIGTIADEASHWSFDVSQQLGQRTGIADMLGGQAGRHDVATLGVETDMQFVPCFPRPRQPVLLRHLVPAAVDTQTRAINNERDRAVTRSYGRRDL